MGILRFLRARFGRYVEKELGYSLRVTYKNFPGMNIEYVEGPRTMNVFSEVMANGKDLDVDLSTFGRCLAFNEVAPHALPKAAHGQMLCVRRCASEDG
jgi:hypothetical protein